MSSDINVIYAVKVWFMFSLRQFPGCDLLLCCRQEVSTRLLLIMFQLKHRSLLRLIVRSGLDVPTFATRRLHACHNATAPSGGRWNCGQAYGSVGLYPTDLRCQAVGLYPTDLKCEAVGLYPTDLSCGSVGLYPTDLACGSVGFYPTDLKREENLNKVDKTNKLLITNKLTN
jgi:hypothetical protein